MIARPPPILDAKLVPPRPAAPRPMRARALARLDHLLDTRGLAVVAGPEGFGGRSLLGRWAAERDEGARTAWLRCDAGDNPRRFYAHLVETIARVSDEPAAVRAVADGVVDDADVALEGVPALLGAIGALADVVVVVDGVDRLPSSTRPVLTDLVRYRGGMGIVLLTADRELLEVWPNGSDLQGVTIGVDELRLGSGDVRILVDAAGIQASDDEVIRLCHESGGWLAGIQATIASSTPDRLAPFDVHAPAVAALLHRACCLRLDADLRAFLADLAPAGLVDDAVAAEVSGRRDVAELLERLRRLHLLDERPAGLIVPAPVQDHLVAERRLRDPERLAATRRLAARLHSRAGRAEASLAVLAQAPDDPELVRMLLTVHHQWSAGPHGRRVLAIADAAIAADPHRADLYLVKAWAETLSGQGDAAKATLELLSRLPVAQSLVPLVRAESAAIRTNVARLDGRFADAAVAAEELRTAAALIEPGGPTAYRGAVHDVVPVLVGLARFGNGDLVGAREVLLEATTSSQWSPIALGTIHGTLALIAWLDDDPVGPIHAAIAASHIDPRPSQGDFLGPAALALVGEGADADTAADWTHLAAAELRAPLSTVLACAVEVADAERPEDATSALERARRTIGACAQPGVLPQILARAAAMAAVGDAAPALGEALTDGELRVVRALRGDLTEREIADELHLSHNTVRTYRRRAYRKLGVASRSEAVAKLDAIGGDRSR